MYPIDTFRRTLDKFIAILKTYEIKQLAVELGLEKLLYEVLSEQNEIDSP
jgi:hypothetical protein